MRPFSQKSLDFVALGNDTTVTGDIQNCAGFSDSSEPTSSAFAGSVHCKAYMNTIHIVRSDRAKSMRVSTIQKGKGGYKGDVSTGVFSPLENMNTPLAEQSKVV